MKASCFDVLLKVFGKGVLCVMVFHGVFIGNIYAQDILNVRGKILNKDDFPIENAYIEFAKDTVVKHAVSNQEGVFFIPALFKENYQVSISHLGYNFFSKHLAAIDTMVFYLEQRDYLLNEVVVTADIGKAIRMQDGLIIFDPSYLGNLKMNSVSQIIERLPGVEISSSGMITLNGLATAVKINSHRPGLPTNSLNAYLRSIPADMIKEIVIHSGGSAENKASETGGAINIVLVKENNSFTLGAGGNIEFIKKDLAGGGNVYYTMQQKNISFSAYLGANNLYTRRERNSHTAYGNGINSINNENSLSRRHTYNASFNFDYVFKNQSVLHTNAFLYYEKVPQDAEVMRDFISGDTKWGKSSDLIHKDEKGDLYEFYMNYKTKETDAKLKHNAGYGIVWGKEWNRYKAANQMNAQGGGGYI
jgi:hypothetical protein